MTTIAEPTPKTVEIRAGLGHPIVDVDAHQLEVIPVILDFLRDVGGPGMPDRFLQHFGWVRRTFKLTDEERFDTRAPVPVWWPMPTENTIDRATTVLPGLLYDRMDEIGLDFSIVYPGTGLLVVTLPGMADEELRRAAARAYNLYNAEMFAGFEDRLTPAAVIPMHTPEEAIEELDYAIGTLGLKVALLAGDVLRPIPAIHREHPDLDRQVFYQDCFGIDSPYDYDPVWQKCLDLGVAPTFHSGPIGWATRASISRHQYNQLGGFAEGGEAIAKSLFFGGVPHRFPGLKFGFLEGGVAWAQSLYCRMLEHWKKRNVEAILHLDPSLLDGNYFAELIDAHGHEKMRHHRDQLVQEALWADHPAELDDWSACGLEKPEDVYEQFVPGFYYGCEGDDRLNAVAFDTKVNPFGARLNAMFGSDIGHFDVEDMAGIVEEVYELIEKDLVTERDFRDFTFENAVRLHGGMNPDFFEGTRVAAEARKVLDAGPRLTPGAIPLFAGLRVLELGQYVAAPLVGQLLADQGADVLKVERPGGDPYRRAPVRFVAWNRGKRSVVLDLRVHEERDALLALARTADVVVENFRPGVLERLGVDLATLRADNPQLVTCSITGFGTSGPLRDAAGWEPIVHARAGLHVGFGEPDERVWRPFPLASVAAGLLATFGTIAALSERERSGLGQHVETSLLAAALYINGSSIIQGDAPNMGVPGRNSIARMHMYPTADGWLQVVAGTYASGLAFDQLIDEESAHLDGAAPLTNDAGELLAPDVVRARAVMATRTTAEWERVFADLGVPAGGCGTAAQWLSHPLARESGLAVQWPDSPFGDVTALGPPVRIHTDATGDRRVPGAPPALGDARPTWLATERFLAARPDDVEWESNGGVLDGVTILDLTRILPGPLAGRLLAELGAQVTKIEPPGGEQGYDIPFMYLEGNRSKSSVEIDLGDERGRKEFRDLARDADVVIENARAGVWERMGLGEDDLHALNPRLIYARSKGYGVDGPLAGLRAYEHVLQALTGIQVTQGGSGAPRLMTIPASDYASPLYLAIGILCSRFSGRRNDAWPTVSASLAVAASVYEAEHLTRIDGTAAVRDEVGDDLHGPRGDQHIYRVADGWVTIFAVSPEQRAALGAALAVDPADVRQVEGALRDRSVDDVVARLTAAGVPAAPSVAPRDVAADAQVVACDLLVTFVHPKIGRVVQVGIPFSLSRTPPRVRGAAPVLPGDVSRWSTQPPGAPTR